MSIVGGLDIHRKQLTFDYVEVETGRFERGRIAPADREHLAGWLSRFAGVNGAAFAMEGCTGWRYVAEEMRNAGVEPHLAEPADTSALRGPKRRAKTDKADAQLLRELLATGRVPECYVPPSQVLEWRALLELHHDLRVEHTGWAQGIHATCFHQGTTTLGEAGVIRGSRARLESIVDEQLSPVGRLQVNTALSIMDILAEHLDRLRRRLVATARHVNGARALMAAIYGVGPMTSLALCAWLGGPERFSSSRKAVRFTGLDITVHSSAARAGCPGKGRRCCGGCCSRRPRPPPAAAPPATATTPTSRPATTRTGPRCPRPDASSATPCTSWPTSATTRSPSSRNRLPRPWSPGDVTGSWRLGPACRRRDGVTTSGQLQARTCQTAPPPKSLAPRPAQ
jgi:transposase